MSDSSWLNDWFGLPIELAAFVGGALGFITSKAAEHYLSFRWQEVELYGDLIMDVLMAVGQFEEYHNELSVAKDFRCPKCLRHVASYWSALPLVLTTDRVLTGTNDRRVHELVIQYADRQARFERKAREHEAAFIWLIDHDANWTTESGQERQAVVRQGRAKIREFSSDLVALAYEISVAALEASDEIESIRRLGQDSIHDHVREKYGLDLDSLRAKAKYWRSVCRSTAAHDPGCGSCVGPSCAPEAAPSP